MSRSALRQCFYPLALTAALLLSACSSLEFPGVYKLTIQQGNIVSQEMVDRLKPGMTRSQVQFVLGNPVLADSFERNRWSYVYTIDIPGQTIIELDNTGQSSLLWTRLATQSLLWTQLTKQHWCGHRRPNKALVWTQLPKHHGV